MPDYNFTKRADRERAIKDAQDELDAIKVGRWPRDIGDSVRWSTPRPQRVASILRDHLDWLQNIPRRIDEGDPDLQGWEP